MFRFRCSYPCWCVIIAIWTIVQTAAHFWGIMYVMWWRDCTVDADDKDYYILYLTYFFTRKCENETRDSLQTNRNVILTLLDNQDSGNSTLDTLNSKVDALIVTYLILDALWIVSSVALLTGACLKIREFWALPFYVPWIILDAVILLFDGFCSIFFGMHIPEDGTIFDWLHFIGINIRLNEVKKLEGDMPSLVAGAASVIMMCISARGVIVWIINLACMVVVVKATKKALQKPLERPSPNARRRNLSYTPSERIRKWNQFYGAVEGKRGRDGDSEVGEDGPVVVRGSVDERLNNVNNSMRGISSGSSDSNGEGESEGNVGEEGGKGAVETVPMKELRGQVPWRYVDAQVEAIRPDIVHDKLYPDEGVSKF